MQTIGKIIFASVFLGGMLGIVCAMLGSIGALPDSLYSGYYQAEESLVASTGGDTSWPSFRQFEGHWKVELQPAAAESDIAACVPVEGYALSHNGSMSGTLHSFNPYSSVVLSTTIDQSGAATGDIKSGTRHSGSLTATFDHGAGEGTWQDDIDCSGTITFTKVSPAVDPVAGHIVSTSGSVTLSRNGQTFNTYPGVPLYAGDLLITGSGSSAHLGIGITNTSTEVGSGARYAVPNPPGQ